jgi:hypothetical protein
VRRASEARKGKTKANDGPELASEHSGGRRSTVVASTFVRLRPDALAQLPPPKRARSSTSGATKTSAEGTR